MSDGATRNELTRSIGLALLPQPFPLRREVEFAAALAGSAGSTCYYDTFWLDPCTVAFAVIRLPLGGLEGAMSGAALKELLRAALTKFRDPGNALQTCLRLGQVRNIDAAVVMLDLQTGRSIQAVSGSGEVRSDDSRPLPPGLAALAPGMSLRLTVGAFGNVPVTIDTATAAVSTMAERILSNAAGDAVAGVVLYKRAVHPPNTELVTLANDLAEIPRTLAAVERFCTLRGIEPQAVDGIDLAVDEILTNVISYAFRDGARHIIDVEISFAGNFLSIEIRDDGSPFDPLKIPPPDLTSELAEREVGGLGIHFVRTVADEVGYRREGGWNILRLIKRTDTRGKGGAST